MPKIKFDFSGYATKHGLKCTDGRTIVKGAFKHQDGQTVPLVWQHLYNDPSNILGHVVLEHRDDGVYCYGKFNDTEVGKHAKQLVRHGDISSLSIYANQLKEQTKQVLHGAIREVSLVLSGANPGAHIDNVSFAHADGTSTIDESEAIIYSGIEFTHDSDSHERDTRDSDLLAGFTDEQKKIVEAIIMHTMHEDYEGFLQHNEEDDDKTVQDVFDTFSEEQKTVVYYLIETALQVQEKEVKQSDINGKGDSNMKLNVFDKSTQEASRNTLTHDQMASIISGAKKHGSLKESFLTHATEYGFDPVDILFPDAKDVTSGGPEVIKRDTTWVDDVLVNTNHTPFSRIRTRVANLTAEEARAKGYVTGTLKKDDVIPLLKRVTTPTTIYKKQKLDRDDMIDITDFEVVVWLKKEMRESLNEELARAILLSDGRSVADEDKINELNIRPIAMDDDNVFVHRVSVKNDETVDNIIDEFIRARKYYKGSGVPALYVSTDLLTEMLLLKDQFGHRLYKTVQELASVLRVSRIVEVEPMNDAFRTVGTDAYQILGIVVNLKDYTVGADKGGQVAMFDDFDIDYNQYKYLIETRASGALTKPKSALIVERRPQGVSV